MYKNQGLAITILRFHGVMVITSAFTRRRSPVRCRLESNCFKISLWVSYSKAILEDRIEHQKHKKAVTGYPLKGFRHHCPRALYCTEQSNLPNSLNATGSTSGGKEKLLETTYRKTLFGSSELRSVKLLKKYNFRRKLTEKHNKTKFFPTRESMVE